MKMITNDVYKDGLKIGESTITKDGKVRIELHDTSEATMIDEPTIAGVRKMFNELDFEILKTWQTSTKGREASEATMIDKKLSDVTFYINETKFHTLSTSSDGTAKVYRNNEHVGHAMLTKEGNVKMVFFTPLERLIRCLRNTDAMAEARGDMLFAETYGRASVELSEAFRKYEATKNIIDTIII